MRPSIVLWGKPSYMCDASCEPRHRSLLLLWKILSTIPKGRPKVDVSSQDPQLRGQSQATISRPKETDRNASDGDPFRPQNGGPRTAQPSSHSNRLAAPTVLAFVIQWDRSILSAPSTNGACLGRHATALTPSFTSALSIGSILTVCTPSLVPSQYRYTSTSNPLPGCPYAVTLPPMFLAALTN
mmetsp:Transcript_18755/g.38075  ORF Transcript_18755/g.38075 Transcript_18755/m.38075 type:complete len:184 (+) Transcript_18755:32-583(+)